MPWYGYHSYLTDFIRSQHCLKIMEIGVYDGDNAVDMIIIATESSPDSKVEYYGFDYFSNYSKAQISAKLKSTNCRYHLFEGDTLETLPLAIGNLPPMDLIFIDGGKSYKEAQSDWEYSSRLLRDGAAVFIHNYDFYGVRRMVDGISKREYDVKLIREESSGLVARVSRLSYSN